MFTKTTILINGRLHGLEAFRGPKMKLYKLAEKMAIQSVRGAKLNRKRLYVRILILTKCWMLARYLNLPHICHTQPRLEDLFHNIIYADNLFKHNNLMLCIQASCTINHIKHTWWCALTSKVQTSHISIALQYIFLLFTYTFFYTLIVIFWCWKTIIGLSFVQQNENT